MEKRIDLQLFANADADFTKVTDVVVPELYAEYMHVKTAELSRVINSGIAIQNSILDAFAANGGVTFTLPYFNDLSGDSLVMKDDGNAIASQKITSGKQIATRIIRIQAWSIADLSGILAGADPLGEFYEKVARYWEREEQKILMAILKGLFNNTNGALKDTHLNNIADTLNAEGITPQAILDTKQKLGDASDKLTTMIMHSATFTELQKQNLIEYVEYSDAKVRIPYYMGYRVIVDDGVLTDGSGVYYTFIFGNGAILRGNGTPTNNYYPIEVERNARASVTSITTRHCIVFHPTGMQWTGTPTDETPTNTELAVGSNWAKAFDDKLIPIVALRHKLTSTAAAKASSK